MTSTSLAMVVLAACLHASWNLMSKHTAAAGVVFVFASSTLALVAFAPWALWIVVQHPIVWTWQVAGCIFLSALINLTYSLCLQRGYQVADLSVVYPIARGTGPLLSSICAYMAFSESPTLTGVSGLIGVITGIGLITTQGNLHAFRRPAGKLGLFWGGATGALIAAYTIIDASAIKMLDLQPVFFFWSSTLLRVAMMAPVVLRDPAQSLRRMQGNWWLAMGVGLLSTLSYALILTVLQMGAPVSIVAPAREMSMMVGTLLGMVILKEHVGPWRLTGCIVLVGGVICLGAARP